MQLAALLKAGHIAPSSSAWGSPCLFVKKAGSTKLRLCIDYRFVNQQCQPDGSFVPAANDLIEHVARFSLYTQLDLASAFHSIAMDPDSIDVTAFNSPLGSFVWRSMPFGLQAASQSQQRLMQHIFRVEIANGEVVVYIDDLVICGHRDRPAEHRDLVHRVLKRLEEHGLRLRAPKCHFAVESILS